MADRFLLIDDQAIFITNRPPPCTGNININGQLVDVAEFGMGRHRERSFMYWRLPPEACHKWHMRSWRYWLRWHWLSFIKYLFTVPKLSRVA